VTNTIGQASERVSNRASAPRTLLDDCALALLAHEHRTFVCVCDADGNESHEEGQG
jgi:hypothetical protein